MQAHERTAFCDKLKLQFNDISEVEVQQVRLKMRQWLNDLPALASFTYAEDLLKKMRFASYTWTEKGKKHKGYSFEWTGICADAVLMAMPVSWHQFISYLHSKVYLAGVEKAGYREWANRASDEPMFRNVSKLGPRRSSEDKDFDRVPGLRIGSNKSDLQVLWYQDARHPVGVESRFKDEKLRRLLQKYAGANTNYGGPSSAIWSEVLISLAQEGDALNRKLQASCNVEYEDVVLGSAMTAAQLQYYFNFMLTPVFGFKGELINPSGFTPIHADKREEMNERQFQFFEEFSDLGITEGEVEGIDY